MPTSLLTCAFLLAASLFARTDAVDGFVIALDPAARTMRVSHRPIAHYMPAMMMPFRVENPAELKESVIRRLTGALGPWTGSERAMA